MPTLRHKGWSILYIKRLTLLFFAVLLAACQAAPAVRPPAPTPQMLRIQYTPGLRAWVAALNRCANALPLVGLVMNETPADRLDFATADLALRFGPPIKMPPSALQLGTDEVVLIVNPANPLTSLNDSAVTAIYSGQTAQWGDLLKGQILPVQAWTYLPGDDLRQVFEAAFLGGRSLSALAYQTPDAAAMLEAVAKTPAAIGYVLKSQLDGTVRQLSLSSQPASDLRQPVLALANSEPQGNLRQLLLCLQK